MTADLIAFLRARLDEDEVVALAASPGPWRPDEEGDEVVAVDGITVAEGFALSGRQLRATVYHIARHDPARTLAEVEAKRKAVHFYEQAVHSLGASAPGAPPHDLMTGAANTARAILQALATTYADHPDYRDAWRP
ncbi:DUF6221 family protein [Streptomyces albidoflavus]